MSLKPNCKPLALFGTILLLFGQPTVSADSRNQRAVQLTGTWQIAPYSEAPNTIIRVLEKPDGLTGTMTVSSKGISYIHHFEGQCVNEIDTYAARDVDVEQEPKTDYRPIARLSYEISVVGRNIILCRIVSARDAAVSGNHALQFFRQKGNTLLAHSTIVKGRTATVRLISIDGNSSLNTEPRSHSVGSLVTPISAGVDFKGYNADLRRRIKKHWFPPKGNDSAHIVLTFKVTESGNVSKLIVDQSCGDKAADNAALRAVEDAAPFRPLPPGVPADVDVRMTFD